ncbi:hypothetical protein FA15DRAFT_622304 [Coprinopsis marcescibilis]|uniref:Hyaluronan-mediated motility receptor C-terminal domain-containing protein n=1 Tax=Coprinopsis marcescibilis TaxID=230819 RepID=A0A5C3L342_COPMA|nr:hypothetical protein FA15DRAFT_622304 [Coprinopsis marcescibilis]
MFSKGQRFNKPNFPDTPAPNAYNPQESVDLLKRGAFLETTERFKQSRGLSTSPEPMPTMPPKPLGQPSQTRHVSHSSATGDRYAVLQRKLDDLERVHQEGKRTHQAETERLKMELARHQKQHSEQNDSLEKQRRQMALLDARLQELKKAGASDSTQVKELRSELRAFESERDKLRLEASQIAELKAALQATEDKRKQDIKERDAIVAEAERSLAAEKRNKETLARQCEDLKRKAEENSKSAIRSLKVQLNQSKDEVNELRNTLRATQEQASSREEELLDQLEQHRIMLNRVVSEFATLSAQSVRESTFAELRREWIVSQTRNWKLERKLANSEAQVVELAQLVRQVTGERRLLTQHLEDTNQELDFYQTLAETNQTYNADEFVVVTEQTTTQDELQVALAERKTYKLVSHFYRNQCEQFAMTTSILNRQLQISEKLADGYSTQLSETLASHEAIAGRLEMMQNEYLKAQESFALATMQRNSAETELQALQSKVAEQESQLNAIDSLHQATLDKERTHIQRLASTVQKYRMAEEGLRDEIDGLTSELASLEHYRIAFDSLNQKVDSLLARNKVAEDEAVNLADFNAQILGHHNPAQRIVYVDRIRRELADCKQKVAELEVERERGNADNANLQNELDMYKSVLVPPANKPRTHVTRLTRRPLTSKILNTLSLDELENSK